MCGIAGIIAQDNQDNLSMILNRMLVATKHRGPNHSGNYVSDGVAIGMNRLSIIDLSEMANQPLYSDDGNFVIVYNGEIYNYIEIRNVLESKGVRFKTHSDTEVVLEAYLYYGTKVVNFLRGMFAFVIWDKKSKMLFGARDHLGIKPLLYSVQNNRFVFCSELKGFLASSLFDNRPLDNHSLNTYLSIGNTIPPFTMIEGISALKSGHYFIYENNNFQEIKYWFPENIIPLKDNDISYDECVKEVRELVLKSVEEELMSDVPLGVFQSGGLDSTIVTAAMRIGGVKTIKSYTIGFEQSPSGIDESEVAEVIAKHYNTNHTTIKVKNSYIEDNFSDYIQGLDQPSADGLNTYLVSKFTAEEVKVALSGLGGDELFVGYYGFGQFLFRRPRIPFNYFKKIIDINTISALLPDKLYHVLYEENAKSSDILTYLFILQRNLERANARIIKNGVYNTTNIQTGKIIEDNYAFSSNPLNKIKQLYITQFMGNMLLRDSDAVAMKSSLEVRFPLIDKRLVEFSFQIPEKYQISQSGILGRNYTKDGIKRILRDAFKHDLPPVLSNRSKQGFQLPTNVWLNGPLASILNETLKNPSSIFNKNEVLLTHKQWLRDNTKWKKLWSIFMLDRWYKEVYKKHYN